MMVCSLQLIFCLGETAIQYKLKYSKNLNILACQVTPTLRHIHCIDDLQPSPWSPQKELNSSSFMVPLLFSPWAITKSEPEHAPARHRKITLRSEGRLSQHQSCFGQYYPLKRNKAYWLFWSPLILQLLFVLEEGEINTKILKISKTERS